MFLNSLKWFLGLLLAFCLCSVTFASNTDGRVFGLGKKFIGLQVGYGDGIGFNFMGDGDGRLARYLAVFPHIGIGVSNLLVKNSWYQGNFEIMFEGEFIRNFRPSCGFSAGVASLMRYNFRHSHKVVPFIEAGGGIGYLDFDLRDQSDGVTFYPQIGAGVRLFLNDRTSLNLSYRLHHMSNAGIHRRNNSINANLFLIGFSYYLD
jgi:hypothetical protein